jgi:hypothetical protein
LAFGGVGLSSQVEQIGVTGLLLQALGEGADSLIELAIVALLNTLSRQILPEGQGATYQE